MYGLSKLPVPCTGKLFTLLVRVPLLVLLWVALGLFTLLMRVPLLVLVLTVLGLFTLLVRVPLLPLLWVALGLLTVLTGITGPPVGFTVKVLPSTGLLGGVLVTSVTPSGSLLIASGFCWIGSFSGVSRVE